MIRKILNRRRLILAAVVIDPPVITSGQPDIFQPNTAFSYQITASNNPSSFNATGLPAGLSINTSSGLISGQVANVGEYDVSISATNEGGSNSESIVLRVANIGNAGVVFEPLSADVCASNNSIQLYMNNVSIGNSNIYYSDPNGDNYASEGYYRQNTSVFYYDGFRTVTAVGQCPL